MKVKLRKNALIFAAVAGFVLCFMSYTEALSEKALDNSTTIYLTGVLLLAKDIVRLDEDASNSPVEEMAKAMNGGDNQKKHCCKPESEEA